MKDNTVPLKLIALLANGGHMRTTKLPDPKVNGNAGSFFKNPVVSAETAKALLSQFPTAPNYPQADGSVKLGVWWCAYDTPH